MIDAVVAGAVGLAIVVPHLLPLERVHPATAGAVWAAALVLRASVVLAGALSLVWLLPASELFGLVTHWCWHAVVPVLAGHLGVNGHELGDTAALGPILIVGASLVTAAVGIWRAAKALRVFLTRSSQGLGPRGSVVVADPGVLVAAAGLARPTVVVSAGALAHLDDEELAAGLEHEHGHIERRHRFVLVTAELCRAAARFLPGTRKATQELRFHLERDADLWAIRRNCDPVVLASAICKTAMQRLAFSPVLTPLGGRGAASRVSQLLARSARVDSRSRGPTAVATLMVAITVIALGMLPVAALAQRDRLGGDHGVHSCPA